MEFKQAHGTGIHFTSRCFNLLNKFWVNPRSLLGFLWFLGVTTLVVNWDIFNNFDALSAGFSGSPPPTPLLSASILTYYAKYYF